MEQGAGSVFGGEGPAATSPSEESGCQGPGLQLLLGRKWGCTHSSRSPNNPSDIRRPAEPAGAPKAIKTAVKSEARAVVTNQSAEESRESSSTTEAEDAPAGADEERANEPKSAPGRAVPEPAAAPAIAGEEPEQDAPLDQGATPGPSSGVAPVAEPGLEEPPSPRAKQESSDSCYEPVRLVQAQPLTEEHRALPPPDFSVSMRFSTQLKDSQFGFTLIDCHKS